MVSVLGTLNIRCLGIQKGTIIVTTTLVGFKASKGLGFRVEGLGFRASGFRISGLGLKGFGQVEKEEL